MAPIPNNSGAPFRVLLVGNPKSIFGFSQLARVPHLGLCSIAANLERSLCDVHVVDLVVKGNRAATYFAKLLNAYQPDVVGISCMVFQSYEALRLAAIAKARDNRTIVVLGGYHPTTCYDEILQNDEVENIDFTIRGEGEAALNELLLALRGSKDFRSVPGLSFRENGAIVHNPMAPPAALDALKLPDRESRLIKKGFHTFGIPADVVETSRGCTYDCNFCSISQMYGRSYRTYKIERVLDDIRDAKKRGARAIMITDDNITLDGERYKRLCEAITDAGLNDLKYSLQAGVGGIRRTHGLAEAMARSGVKWVFLGIEGASDASLAAMGKNKQFDVTDTVEVVRELKRLGITVIGGFIVGYPDDSEESLWATFEFARTTGVDIPLFQILTPYPKTVVRDELMKLGFVTNELDYSRYTCYDANVRTKYLSADRLGELRDKIEEKYRYESGATWRLMRKYPLLFVRIIPEWLAEKPGEALAMLRHLVH